MSEPENIQEFNLIVATLFNDLYLAFPRRITVLPAKYLGFKLSEQQDGDPSGIIVVSLSDSSESRLPYKKLDVVTDCIKWLEQTGYIYIEQSNYYHSISGVTLTAKGLEILKAVPSTIDSSQSIGEQLHEAVESGGKQAASNIVSTALTAGYSLLVQAAINS